MHNAPQDRPAGDEFERWELDLVSRLVDDFIAERRLPGDVEFDDVFQECLSHWWSQRGQYDDRRGASRKTFLRKVVRGKLRDLARAWRAEKRGSGQQPLSLDAPASRDDPEGPAIGDLLADQAGPDPAFAADWEKLTARLSTRQRKIIAGVTAGMPKTELSRRLGMSRDTLHKELRRIQKVFREEGLAPYLG